MHLLSSCLGAFRSCSWINIILYLTYNSAFFLIGGRGFSLSSFVSEFLSFEILFFHIFFSLFIPLIFALWCLIPVGSTAANHCSPFSFPLFLSMTFHLYCCGAVLIGESKIPITVSSMLPYICIYVCMYFFFFCSSLPLSWPPSLRMQSTHAWRKKQFPKFKDYVVFLRCGKIAEWSTLHPVKYYALVLCISYQRILYWPYWGFLEGLVKALSALPFNWHFEPTFAWHLWPYVPTVVRSQ